MNQTSRTPPEPTFINAMAATAKGSDLPRAEIRGSGESFFAQLRHRLTVGNAIRGIVLGPLVAHLLVGTALLFAVSQLERLAARLGSWGPLHSLHPNAWHESTWASFGFPATFPVLALRAALLLSAAFALWSASTGWRLARDAVANAARLARRAARAAARWLAAQRRYVIETARTIRRMVADGVRAAGAAVAWLARSLKRAGD